MASTSKKSSNQAKCYWISLYINWQTRVITLERLFKNMYGKSLHQNLWNIHDASERLKYLVNNVVELTGLKDFGKYMNKLLTIDEPEPHTL